MNSSRRMYTSLTSLARYATLLALLCLLPTQMALGAVIPNGIYLIQMADSDHVVFHNVSETPPRVTLKNFSRSDLWSFEHLGNDYYKVTEQSYHLVLDSFRSEKYNGVPAITFPWHGGKNQRWKVIRKGEFYSLICQETGLALDLKNNQQKVGGVFQGYTAIGTRGQLFRLTLASEAQAQQKPAHKPTDDQAKSFSNGPTAQ